MRRQLGAAVRTMAAAVLAWAGAATMAGQAVAGVYEQRFTYPIGTTSFGDGSTLSEVNTSGLPLVAGVQDESQRELQLTAANTQSTRSAFRLPELDPGQPIMAFSARWNAQVYHPTARADGYSLSFGNLPANLVSSAHQQEDGFGTGLSVGVRTFTGTVNGQTVNPGLRAYVNGQERAFANSPDWATISYARSYWEVDWTVNDGLTLRVNGQTYLDRVPTTGFTPTAGMRLAFAARTGGYSEEVRLDNLSVVTGGVLRPVAMTGATASDQNAPNETAAAAFDGAPGFNGISITQSAPTTKWLMFKNAGWIGATTADGNAHTITAYTIVSGNDSPNRYPRDWTLQGSTDGTTWSVLDTVTGEQSRYSFNTPRSYLVDAPGSYSRYRLVITNNNWGLANSVTQLSEIVLYETVAVPEPLTALLPIALIAITRRTRRRS